MTNKNCRQIRRRRASRGSGDVCYHLGRAGISRDDRDVPACRPVARAGTAWRGADRASGATAGERSTGPRQASGRAAGRSTTSRKDCRRARRFRCCRRRETILESRLSKDDPQASCLPSGVPRIAPYPWRIVQTPTHIFFLFEGNIHSYRQIFMDGRPASRRSRSDVVRPLDRAVGGRHAGHRHRRLQRQVLVRLQGPPAHRAPAHRRALHAEGLPRPWSTRSPSTIPARTRGRSR